MQKSVIKILVLKIRTTKILRSICSTLFVVIVQRRKTERKTYTFLLFFLYSPRIIDQGQLMLLHLDLFTGLPLYHLDVKKLSDYV